MKKHKKTKTIKRKELKDESALTHLAGLAVSSPFQLWKQALKIPEPLEAAGGGWRGAAGGIYVSLQKVNDYGTYIKRPQKGLSRKLGPRRRIGEGGEAHERAWPFPWKAFRVFMVSSEMGRPKINHAHIQIRGRAQIQLRPVAAGRVWSLAFWLERCASSPDTASPVQP